MPQQRKKTERLPGGLLVEIPLPPCTCPTVFFELAHKELHTEELGVDFRDSARKIVRALQTPPKTINGYTRRHEYRSFVSWAREIIDAHEKPCPNCDLLFLSGDEFELFVTKDFCLDSDVKEGALLTLELVGRRDAKGNVISETARVKKIDLSNSKIIIRSLWRKLFKEGRYDVYITPNAMNFRSRYRTIKWITDSTWLSHWVFPELQNGDSIMPLNAYEQFESNALKTFKLSGSAKPLNLIQKAAVFAIQSGVFQDVPYILFGPPGTGKTTVLVEAIRSLVEQDTSARILFCTPSNSASDHFTIELLKTKCLPENQIFRLFSLSKLVSEQNVLLRDVVFTTSESGQEVFGIEPKQLLSNYRVIVCTLSASSYLVSGALQGFFSHIFVDEAGQAQEIETLIPIVGLAASKGTRIILAGDPRQLGPVETCRLLRHFDFHGSLIERLIQYRIEQQSYQFDRRFTRMLQYNYRSHPGIIFIPSELFYGGLLKPAMFKAKCSLLSWSGLPNKDLPVIWHNVEGKERIKSGGFSYCNETEVDIVVDYVRRVLDETDVRPDQIGVISPYRHQVEKIRLKLHRYPTMCIDSVERYQGSERRVIIVSTVRTDGLGFLSDDKRFNTTITRSEELLIIVGSSRNLSTGKSWNRFIEFCNSHKAIIEDPQNIVQKQPLSGLLSAPDEIEDNDGDDIIASIDRFNFAEDGVNSGARPGGRDDFLPSNYNKYDNNCRRINSTSNNNQHRSLQEEFDQRPNWTETVFNGTGTGSCRGGNQTSTSTMGSKNAPKAREVFASHGDEEESNSGASGCEYSSKTQQKQRQMEKLVLGHPSAPHTTTAFDTVIDWSDDEDAYDHPDMTNSLLSTSNKNNTKNKNGNSSDAETERGSFAHSRKIGGFGSRLLSDEEKEGEEDSEQDRQRHSRKHRQSGNSYDTDTNGDRKISGGYSTAETTVVFGDDDVDDDNTKGRIGGGRAGKLSFIDGVGGNVVSDLDLDSEEVDDEDLYYGNGSGGNDSSGGFKKGGNCHLKQKEGIRATGEEGGGTEDIHSSSSSSSVLSCQPGPGFQSIFGGGQKQKKIAIESEKQLNQQDIANRRSPKNSKNIGYGSDSEELLTINWGPLDPPENNEERVEERDDPCTIGVSGSGKIRGGRSLNPSQSMGMRKNCNPRGSGALKDDDSSGTEEDDGDGSSILADFGRRLRF